MKKIFLFCIVFLLCPQVWALDSNYEKAFLLFVKKIELKYSLDSQIEVFQKLSQALYMQEKKNLPSEKMKLLSELGELNNEILFEKKQERISSQETQREKEELLRKALEEKIQGADATIPAYVSLLTEAGKKLYEVNETFEYVDGEKIEKVFFTKYYPLSSQNSSSFKNKSGIIVKNISETEYWFVEDYSVEEKIPYSKLGAYFLAFITDETNFVTQQDSYYGFVYSRFSYLDDTYGVYLSSLDKLSVDTKKSLLYQDISGRYNFISEYKKVFLAKKETLLGIPNKEKILLYLRDDGKDGLLNSDATLTAIKKQTESLSTGKKQQEKIEHIYFWIIDHLEYSKTIDFEDPTIFSGLKSYENKEGVCTGYTKLMAYMLAFAGVSQGEMLLGDVIDAQDFPQIGHAWIQIGDYYYDPTFDDPIGNTKSRTKQQYRYYQLPRDLFYTNRYNRGDTPTSLKSTDMLYRETRVELNLSKLVEKYKDQDYNLLKPFEFRKRYDIAYNKDITPQILKDILPYYEVEGSTFSFIDESGKKKFIRGLNYYTIDNSTTETALRELDFDTDGLYLFAWKDGNAGVEYRLSYDVEF